MEIKIDFSEIIMQYNGHENNPFYFNYNKLPKLVIHIRLWQHLRKIFSI